MYSGVGQGNIDFYNAIPLYMYGNSYQDIAFSGDITTDLNIRCYASRSQDAGTTKKYCYVSISNPSKYKTICFYVHYKFTKTQFAGGRLHYLSNGEDYILEAESGDDAGTYQDYKTIIMTVPTDGIITFQCSGLITTTNSSWRGTSELLILSVFGYTGENSINKYVLNDIFNKSTKGTGITATALSVVTPALSNTKVVSAEFTASGSTANQKALICTEDWSKYLCNPRGSVYLLINYTCTGDTFKIAGSNTTTIGGNLIKQKTISKSTGEKPSSYSIRLDDLISYAHPYFHLLLTSNNTVLTIHNMTLMYGYFPDRIKKYT